MVNKKKQRCTMVLKQIKVRIKGNIKSLKIIMWLVLKRLMSLKCKVNVMACNDVGLFL